MVSLTLIPRKVMEQVMPEAILEHIKECKQSAQIYDGKSCLTRLIAFCDDTADWVDEKKVLDIVFIDFGKAFDTASHNLIDKRMKYRLGSGERGGLKTGCTTGLNGLSTEA